MSCSHAIATQWSPSNVLKCYRLPICNLSSPISIVVHAHKNQHEFWSFSPARHRIPIHTRRDKGLTDLGEGGSRNIQIVCCFPESNRFSASQRVCIFKKIALSSVSRTQDLLADCLLWVYNQLVHFGLARIERRRFVFFLCCPTAVFCSPSTTTSTHRGKESFLRNTRAGPQKIN